MRDFASLMKFLSLVTGYGSTRMAKAIQKANGTYNPKGSLPGTPDEQKVRRWMKGVNPREGAFTEAIFVNLLTEFFKGYSDENINKAIVAAVKKYDGDEIDPKFEAEYYENRFSVFHNEEDYIKNLYIELFRSFPDDHRETSANKDIPYLSQFTFNRTDEFISLKEKLINGFMDLYKENRDNYSSALREFGSPEDVFAYRSGYFGLGYIRERKVNGRSTLKGGIIKEGLGIESDDNEIYGGEWKKDLKHGKGFLISKNENLGEYIFEGEFRDGHFYEGKTTFVNGDIYEGYYNEYNEPCGKGVYTRVNGAYYKGTYDEDGMPLEGELITADGTRGYIAVIEKDGVSRRVMASFPPTTKIDTRTIKKPAKKKP